MKTQSGFTLVELMIVVAVIGILLAIAIMNFTQWNDKFTVESYTKHIYSILMKARNDAANTNSQVYVTLTANLVTTLQDTNNNGVANAGEPTTSTSFPRFAIKSSDGALPQTILFNSRGITADNQTISIPVRSVADPTGYSPNAGPGVDCIAVAATRINMGRLTGGTCVQ